MLETTVFCLKHTRDGKSCSLSYLLSADGVHPYAVIDGVDCGGGGCGGGCGGEFVDVCDWC